jgi:hypothetical protein
MSFIVKLSKLYLFIFGIILILLNIDVIIVLPFNLLRIFNFGLILWGVFVLYRLYKDGPPKDPTQI